MIQHILGRFRGFLPPPQASVRDDLFLKIHLIEAHLPINFPELGTVLGIKGQEVPTTDFFFLGVGSSTLFSLHNKVKTQWTGSGPPSYIQVGPPGSDVRGPGAQKMQFGQGGSGKFPFRVRLGKLD